MKNIPVYEIKIPEYKIREFDNKSEKIKYKITSVFVVKIPKVYEENKPNFEKIGNQIDICLKKNFLNKKVAIRAISSGEHSDKLTDELIEIIKKKGTDRYNLNINGDRYENIENKHIDFFALDFEIKKEGKYFRQILESFYYYPISEGISPVRIDIVIIYDLSQLEVVEHRYKGREVEVKRDGFVFKKPYEKNKAILGIIKII